MHRKFSWICRITCLPPLAKAFSLSFSSRKTLASFLIDTIQTWPHLSVALQKTLHSSFSWWNLNSVSHELCSDNFPSFCFWLIIITPEHCPENMWRSCVFCSVYSSGKEFLTVHGGMKPHAPLIIPVVLIQRVVLLSNRSSEIFWLFNLFFCLLFRIHCGSLYFSLNKVQN